MADIGYVALFLALIVSFYSVFAFISGTRQKNPALLQSARNSLFAVCGLLTLAVLILLYAIFTHDFKIEYVASYTSRDLSAMYLFSALWAGSHGSLLFWAWLLSVLATIMVLQRRTVANELVPWASAITMATQAFFLILLVSIANPFIQLPFTPADGQGLNPLLENPGMIMHPPTLLGGYVGFTIPFAFAMAALITRRLGDEWLLAARRWMILAWLSLSIGNVLGSWWAYVELGWGGYWAWDPVENAGLLPWLVGAAFLHSSMMQRRRGILKVWNMVLIILTFTLSVFGTFLTRSGILSSVHSFGESALGPFFLSFIGVTLFASLGLLYYRSSDLKGEAEMESLISRESTFLLNNLLLVGATFAIFLGVIFPLISEAVRGVKISVGPPFFNQVNAPIFLAIILLAGICTLIGWRRASLKNLIYNFLWPAVAALLLGIVLVVLGMREWYAVVAFSTCAFVIATILSEWVRGVVARHHLKGENFAQAFANLILTNRPRYGGYIVHIGIVIMAIGITGSSLFAVSKEVILKPGESVNINQYMLTFDRTDTYQTASKLITSTTLSIYNGGELLGKLTPTKYVTSTYEPVTDVAIRSNLREDLYVIPISTDQDGVTAFKFLVNPLVVWIWIGAWVLVAGSLLAFWPQRQRAPSRQTIKAKGE